MGRARFSVTSLDTSNTGIRGVLGYWDDSEGDWVRGKAGEGAVVILDLAGAQDFGGEDNILVLNPGVIVLGPGVAELTLGCRLYCVGDGHNRPTRICGVTFDANGQAVLPVALDDTGVTGALYKFVATDFQGVDCRFTNSDPATTNEGNNFSIVADTDKGADLDCRLERCQMDNAYADCCSLKTIGTKDAGQNRITLVDCDMHTPGSGATDQALTGHERWRVIVRGGRYACNTAGSGHQAIGSAAGCYVDVEGAFVAGKLVQVNRVVGCVLRSTRDADDFSDTAIVAEPNCWIQGNWLFGACGNHTSDFYIALDRTVGDARRVDVVRDNVILGNGNGTGIFADDGGDGYKGTLLVLNNLIVGVQRGVYSAATDAEHLYDLVAGNVIDASQYSILGTAGVTATRLNLVSAPPSTISLDATDEQRTIAKAELRQRLAGFATQRMGV